MDQEKCPIQEKITKIQTVLENRQITLEFTKQILLKLGKELQRVSSYGYFFREINLILSRSRHLKTESTFPSTCSDDYLPKSTSEDSENVSLPKLAPIKNLPRSNHHLIPKYHERFQHLQRSGSLKSISSNISVESVHDYVKEKEDIWREKHNCPSRRKIRQQTLI